MDYLLVGTSIGFVGLFLISSYIWEYKLLNGNLEHSSDDIGKSNSDDAWTAYNYHKSKGKWVILLAVILLVISFFTIW